MVKLGDIAEIKSGGNASQGDKYFENILFPPLPKHRKSTHVLSMADKKIEIEEKRKAAKNFLKPCFIN